ncbi:MAG: DUF4136 domain-containing protein [Longimicrobiales bacterium]
MVRAGFFPRGLRVGLAAGLVAAAAVTGCYPGALSEADVSDIVLTAFDPAFDFSSAQTWAMPDTVVAIDLEGTNNAYAHTFDAEILAQVASNMAALGYTRELDPLTNGADLVVLVQANVSNNFSAYTWYPYDPYWGFYPGWGYWGGYPGYGGYYPWTGSYPPTTTIDNVRTGSIVIDMIDPNVEGSAEEGPSLSVRWGAILNGFADGVTASRITDAIDQAFDQSPALGR